ncbi:DUF29 domain-containing protein [Methylobacterium tarhaniae]|uniref:DUF29 domain-containing protein n=1 Tax=Methylobacterium tarhaniae TaxID=1187852 RepID=UPI003D034235
MDEIRTDQPSLYDEDVVAWAEQQAAALRALGARPDLSTVLDWDNIIEEVESVGRSEISTVERALRLVLVHLIKHLSAPHQPPAQHWRSEIVAFQITGRVSYRPSMRRKINLDKVWRDAVVQAEAGRPARDVALHAGRPRRRELRHRSQPDTTRRVARLHAAGAAPALKWPPDRPPWTFRRAILT